MAYKKGVLTISDWQKGIAESPYLGFADMRNVAIHEPAGVLKIALAPTKISSTTVTALPTWMTSVTESDHYFGGYLDATNIYSINVSTVAAIATGSFSRGTHGAYYKGYIIVLDMGNDHLDAYDYTGGTWDNNFADVATIPSATTTPMLWAEDDVLYGGSGRYIWSLEENSGQNFDPATGATFTFNGTALDLPEDFVVESISELGKNLMIGASILRGGILFEGRNGKLFPWDRASSSFGIPISFEEGGVRQQVSRNNTIILANGRHGKHVITNGSATDDLPEIASLSELPATADGDMFPQASAFVGGEYLFGVSSNDTDFQPAGIYGYRNGAWRFLEISTGEVGENDVVNIGVIHKKDNNKFFVGWQDDNNSAYGVDEFGYAGYRYTDYKARVDSQIYRVGTANNRKSFRMCDVALANPLATDQGVRISYRKDGESSFTVIGTIDYATHGATMGEAIGASIQEAQDVQIRIELTTGSSSTTTPSLREVSFY